MNRYKTVNNLVGWITFAIAAFVYCSTIEPSASYWDCPEFITTGYKLEIGHPPGAPFFMLTANLFSQFAQDPSHVAMMVNVMSALMSAACILFLFWSITHLARKLIVRDGENPTTAQLIEVIGAGVVGALAYTFSDTFWFSAVEGEVYAYSSMFTAVVFWLILKWEERADQPHSDRWLVLISFLTGLSIGVHLLNLLCTVPGDYHIRFMTSHPKDASRKLIDTIAAQDHLCKHIHLPVQSGSDRILKEMNRHYTVAQYMDLVNYAKEKIPGVTFSSDIIVGFPGETEEDFQATLDLIQRVKYMQLFTFIYSKRTGTIAAKLPDPATHAEKAARMDRLLKLQDSIAFPMIAAMAGQTVKVLVEAAGRTPGTLNGRLDNNLVVEFPAEESLIGQYANVRLTGSRAALLVGELAE